MANVTSPLQPSSSSGRKILPSMDHRKSWLLLMTVLVASQVVAVDGKWTLARKLFDSFLDLFRHDPGKLEAVAGETDLPCRCLKVSRTTWDDGLVKFTFIFKSIFEPNDASVTWVDPTLARMDTSTVRVSRSVFLSRFYTDLSKLRGSQSSKVVSVLSCANSRYTMHLLKVKGNVTWEDFSTFDLTTVPDKDIVYRPGRGAQFRAIAPDLAFLNVSGHLRVANSSLIHLDGDDDHNTRAWLDTRLSNPRPKPGRPMSKEFHLATDRLWSSGLIDLSLGKDKISSTIVQSLQMSKRLTLRPSNQSGAFPVYYVRFDTSGLIPRTDGAWEKPCFNDGPGCSLHCDVYGNNLDTVRVFQTLANGTQVPVTSSRMPFDDLFSRSVSVDVWPSDPSQQQANYTCVAHTHDRREHTVNVLIDYVVAVRVVEDASFISRFDRKLVNVTCVIEGRPEPEVQVELIYQTDYKMVYPSQVLPVANHRKVYVALADVYSPTWHDKDLLLTATCHAFRDGLWSSHDSHRLTFTGRR